MNRTDFPDAFKAFVIALNLDIKQLVLTADSAFLMYGLKEETNEMAIYVLKDTFVNIAETHNRAIKETKEGRCILYEPGTVFIECEHLPPRFDVDTIPVVTPLQLLKELSEKPSENRKVLEEYIDNLTYAGLFL